MTGNPQITISERDGAWMWESQSDGFGCLGARIISKCQRH
jgi:hypothetical protein